MTTHSERLAGDLSLIRTLQFLVDDDQAADVAAIVEMASAYLQKVRRYEGYYVQFDDAVDLCRAQAEQLGYPFTPPERPQSSEIVGVEQDLRHSRNLLQGAVKRLNVKEAARMVRLIISGEKRLYQECLSCGLHLRRGPAIALVEGLSQKLLDAHRHEPDFIARVEKRLHKDDPDHIWCPDMEEYVTPERQVEYRNYVRQHYGNADKAPGAVLNSPRFDNKPISFTK